MRQADGGLSDQEENLDLQLPEDVEKNHPEPDDDLLPPQLPVTPQPQDDDLLPPQLPVTPQPLPQRLTRRRAREQADQALRVMLGEPNHIITDL